MGESVTSKRQQEALARFEGDVASASKTYYRRPNILVCGYTGSGKSSLINAILGDDVVPPEVIGAGRPKTMGFDEYPSPNRLRRLGNPSISVRVFDSKGLEIGETEASFVSTVRTFISERQQNPDIDDHIHVVWYVIQGAGARVTECDKHLIRQLFNPNNVLVAVTKSDITRESQRVAIQDELLKAGVPRERIVFTSDKFSGKEGCKELMRKTLDILPDAYRDAFIAKQEVDKEIKKRAVEEKDGKAKGIITAATAAATAAAVTPIPFSDAAVIVPVQITMIASLAGLYGVSDAQIKAQVMPFVARVAGTFLAGSLLKFIPGLGSLAGGLINGTVAATITGGMGLYVQSLFKDAALAKIDGLPMPTMDLNADAFEKFRKQFVKSKS